MASLAALKALLPGKLADLPSPHADPCAWEASWTALPGMWHQIFAAAERLAAKRPAAALRLLFAIPGFVPTGLGMDELEKDEFLCGICAATFGTPGGVATHRLKAHPASAPEPQMLRDSVLGGTCPVCSQDFRHRLRVLHHLRARRGAQSSLGASLGCTPPRRWPRQTRRIACTAGCAGARASTSWRVPACAEPPTFWSARLALLCSAAPFFASFTCGPPLLGQDTGLRRPGRGMGWYRQGNSAARKVCCRGSSLLGFGALDEHVCQREGRNLAPGLG